jgi:CheY-like chemotaxis protein
MVKRRSILIVDDEPEICQVVCDDLMSGGDFSVTIAHDGQRALDLLQENRFDMVITDIVMPVLDGIGLIRRARELNLHKTTKIIVMAGGNLVDRAKNEDDRDLLFNHIDGFLQKPFGSAELFELIDPLLPHLSKRPLE